MNHDDLLKLLDLGARPAAAKGLSPVHPPTGPGAGGGQGAPLSDSALILDKFDRDRGRRVHQAYPGRAKVDAVALADFHNAGFSEEPRLVEHSKAARRREFLETLFDSPEYKTLHDSTRGDDYASELAAAKFADEFLALEDKDREREQKLKGTAGDAKAQAKAARQGEAALHRAVGKALKGAQEEIDEKEEAEAALGAGLGMGGGGKLETKDVASLFQRIKNSPMLRNIFDRAGPMRRFARGAQRRKSQHGYDDMVGVVCDDDPGKLLGSELAKLVDPDLQLLTLARLAQKQTMARNYRGIEPQGKGPIVYLCDGSSSMDTEGYGYKGGKPIWDAKALALTLAWLARYQRRWVALVEFSGGTQGHVLVLPPGRWDEGELLDWLEHFYYGGTSPYVPLKALPEIYWPEFIGAGMKRGQTDVFLATDAQMTVPPEMADAFNAWKAREKVRCYTLLIGSAGGGDAGDLARVSDEVYPVSAVCTEDEGVQRCLAV